MRIPDAERIEALLEEVKTMLADISDGIRLSGYQVQVDSGLSDISERLGLVTAGEFRTGNAKNPGDGFSGVRIGYPAFTYDSVDWHIAGVNNDTLQFGLRATDGTAVAGGGVVTLDDDGITIEPGSGSLGDVNKIKFGSVAYMGGYSDPVLGPPSYSFQNFLYDVAGGQGHGRLQLRASASGDGGEDFNSAAIWLDGSNYTETNVSATIKINAESDDVDTYIYGDSSYLAYFDAGNNRVGIRTITPERDVELYDAVNYGPYYQVTNKYDGVGSGGFVFRKERVTNDYPSDDDRIGALLFSALDTGGTERFPVAIEIFANGSAGADYVPGRIEFSVTNTAGNVTDTMQIGNGVTVGAATGGDKGGGTINVSGNIYKNNSTYTNPDFVLEHWVTGQIEKYADRPRAKDYVPMSIYDIDSYIQSSYRLPGITDDPAGIFDMADIALELIERLFTITIEQQYQIDELRRRCNDRTN